MKKKINKLDYFIYDNSKEEFDKTLSDEERIKFGESWIRTDTLDYWRHARIRAPIVPLIKENLNASWVTIGDGRYGNDASYIMSNGASNVHSTDITDALLKIANLKGLIGDFSAENAESLSFSNSSFDYVYCKEAFHHFPRPYIALYEMFRVCRKAVILAEPRDELIDRPRFNLVMKFLLKIFRPKLMNDSGHGFEAVGNYVYKTSEREIEKFSLGMHYTKVAFIGINDSYVKGVEFTTLDSSDRLDIKLKRKIKTIIGIKNMLQYFGFIKSGLLVSICFKEEPKKDLVEEMTKLGWTFKSLPKNPYI